MSPLNRSTTARVAAVVLLFYFSVLSTFAQQPAQKNVSQQIHFWTSLNTVSRFSKHWGAMADVHVRRDLTRQDRSFFLLRGGVQAWLSDKVTSAAGYAHVWNLPVTEGWSTVSEEDRLFAQLQYSSRMGGPLITLRVRDEFRHMQVIQADTFSGNYLNVNRLRLLSSLTIPLSENPGNPELFIADEVLMNFGKDVVYNTFDQNRFTLGIRQRIGKDWAYDFGYMMVYQQKSSGVDYNLNHTIRLFFYGNFDFRKK